MALQNGIHYTPILLSSQVVLPGKSGKVRPVIQKMYEWEELPQSHHDVESGRIAGKIGISINPDSQL